jgi:GTP cyclohydrolase I
MEDSLKQNVYEFLQIIDEDPNRDGLQDTPGRVARAWKELTTPPKFSLTTFDSNGYDEMIISKDIQYYTFCEHHLLPFFGTIHIGYIPNGRIVGLSKLARTVEYYSKRLNTQEYLTNNIAEFLNEGLKPKGIGVIVTGRHLCQEMRGIKKRGEMITSALKGIFLEKQKVKQEFFNLTNGE